MTGLNTKQISSHYLMMTGANTKQDIKPLPHDDWAEYIAGY
jgi:hypothetical protein